jgi:hypothetical protein
MEQRRPDVERCASRREGHARARDRSLSRRLEMQHAPAAACFAIPWPHSMLLARHRRASQRAAQQRWQGQREASLWKIILRRLEQSRGGAVGGKGRRSERSAAPAEPPAWRHGDAAPHAPLHRLSHACHLHGPLHDEAAPCFGRGSPSASLGREADRAACAQRSCSLDEDSRRSTQREACGDGSLCGSVELRPA